MSANQGWPEAVDGTISSQALSIRVRSVTQSHIIWVWMRASANDTAQRLCINSDGAINS